MEISKIVSGVPNSILNEKAPEKGQQGIGFAELFADAMNSTVGSDGVDKLTNLDTIAGGLTDLHTATIAADQADTVLRLTIQIRNKVVEAYQEVMRMSL